MDVLPEEEILPSWYKLLDHFGLQVLAMITTHHQQTQTLPTEKLMDLLNWWLFFWATDATQAYKAEWGPDLSSSTYKLYASTVHVWASFPHQCQAEDPLRGHVRGLPEATIVGVHLPLARCSQQRSDTSLPLPSAGAGLTPPPHVWAHRMRQGPHVAMSSHRVQCCHVLSARPKCGDCSRAPGFDMEYVRLCRSHPSSFT